MHEAISVFNESRFKSKQELCTNQKWFSQKIQRNYWLKLRETLTASCQSLNMRRASSKQNKTIRLEEELSANQMIHPARAPGGGRGVVIPRAAPPRPLSDFLPPHPPTSALDFFFFYCCFAKRLACLMPPFLIGTKARGIP